MPQKRMLGAALGLAIYASSALADETVKLVTEEFMVPAGDPGVELYLRNKRPDAIAQFSPARTLLFVHGATYPAEATFDFAVDGFSWMDYVARRGFDVYLVDIRGYGRSTRPGEMDEPPAANPPIVHTDTAIRDVGTAVDFILKRRGISRLNLLGWSWGTTIVAGFAAANADKVERLGLHAPIWTAAEPLKDVPEFDAYRTVDRQAALRRWMRGVPLHELADLTPAGLKDAWWKAAIRTDPVGAAREPPVLRAPNGVVHDMFNNWLSGKPMYDPAAVRCATMLAVGEWDQDTPVDMAQTLFPRLTNAAEKRLVVGEGTHMLMLEKNRMLLIREMQQFFEAGVAD